ncbi:MAG: glycine dehydrogenase, partial [Proteobacteria bacterium]|nr:glycine dehydrogenase [Pseudomonadota bacterium]
TTVHPIYRQVVHTIVKNQDITLIDVPFDIETGTIVIDSLKNMPEAAALVIPQPNFFGNLEEVDELTDWAKSKGMLTIGLVNPLTLAVLSPPGEWGANGADIVCGEGQPLGIPLSSGGPYFGFMTCKKKLVRQMPGRIVGRTVDLANKPSYTLTLQAREQHIRRSKATSNICTNQGLMVTAATIHMALLGAKGLENTALACNANTNKLVEKLVTIKGVKQIFTGTYFHEVVLQLEQPIANILSSLMSHNILGGYDLTKFYPELGNCLLVCATEMRTQQDIDNYVDKLRII